MSAYGSYQPRAAGQLRPQPDVAVGNLQFPKRTSVHHDDAVSTAVIGPQQSCVSVAHKFSI